MKAFDQFNKNRSTKDGLHHQCRVCSKIWYATNAEYAKEKSLRQARERKEDIKGRIQDYKLSNPCVDCGENDPVVLDFDHVRGDKLAHVSRMVMTSRPWKVILAEIAKCEVRCANCHRRATHRRRVALKEDALV